MPAPGRPGGDTLSVWLYRDPGTEKLELLEKRGAASDVCTVVAGE